MTAGQMMFFGGIACAVLFGILAIVFWVVYEKKKKVLRKQIEE